MEDTFFTSTEASQITGCSRRQLQYWREKGVVVPAVNASGKGRNVYYSMSDLLELMVMEYLLSVGLSFETAQETLDMIRQKEPNLLKANTKEEDLKQLMVLPSPYHLQIADFDPQEAFMRINSLGLPLVPFRSIFIHQSLQKKLNRTKKRNKY